MADIYIFTDNDEEDPKPESKEWVPFDNQSRNCTKASEECPEQQLIDSAVGNIVVPNGLGICENSNMQLTNAISVNDILSIFESEFPLNKTDRVYNNPLEKFLACYEIHIGEVNDISFTKEDVKHVRLLMGRILYDVLQYTVVSEPESISSLVEIVTEVFKYKEDGSLTTKIMEQMPQVVDLCQMYPHLLGVHIKPAILTSVVYHLFNGSFEGRHTTLAALLVLLEQNMIDESDLVADLIPTVMHYAECESMDLGCQMRAEATTVIAKICPLKGAQFTRTYLLEKFNQLCCDINFTVRRVCVVNFAEVCGVLDQEEVCQTMLPIFVKLCTDSHWSVRKRCTDVFVALAKMCTPYSRKEILTPNFLLLLEDKSNWVSLAAFNILGPFISTFADSVRIPIYKTENGWLTLQPNDKYIAVNEELKGDQHISDLSKKMNYMQIEDPIFNEVNFWKVPLPVVDLPTFELEEALFDKYAASNEHQNTETESDWCEKCISEWEQNVDEIEPINSTAWESEQADVDKGLADHNYNTTMFEDTAPSNYENICEPVKSEEVDEIKINELPHYGQATTLKYNRTPTNSPDSDLDLDSNDELGDIYINKITTSLLHCNDAPIENEDVNDSDGTAEMGTSCSTFAGYPNYIFHSHYITGDFVRLDGDVEVAAQLDRNNDVHTETADSNVPAISIESDLHTENIDIHTKSIDSNVPTVSIESDVHTENIDNDVHVECNDGDCESIHSDAHTESIDSVNTDSYKSTIHLDSYDNTAGIANEAACGVSNNDTAASNSSSDNIHLSYDDAHGGRDTPVHFRSSADDTYVIGSSSDEHCGETGVQSDWRTDSHLFAQRFVRQHNPYKQYDNTQSDSSDSNEADRAQAESDEMVKMLTNMFHSRSSSASARLKNSCTSEGANKMPDAVQVAEACTPFKYGSNEEEEEEKEIGRFANRDMQHEVEKDNIEDDIVIKTGGDLIISDDNTGLQSRCELENSSDGSGWREVSGWQMLPDVVLDSRELMSFHSNGLGKTYGDLSVGTRRCRYANQEYEQERKEYESIVSAIAQHKQNIVPEELLKSYMMMVFPSAEMKDEKAATKMECAFSLPAVALTVGMEHRDIIIHTYQKLAFDENWKVRRTLAASIHEMALILGEETADSFLFDVYLYYIKDIDAVRHCALRSLSAFMKGLSTPRVKDLLPRLSSFMAFNNAIVWRIRLSLVQQLYEIADIISEQECFLYICPIVTELMNSKAVIVRRNCYSVISKLVKILYEMNDKHYVKSFIQPFVETSKANVWWQRQDFVFIVHQMLTDECIPLSFWCSQFFQELMILADDGVPNVRMAVAKILATGCKPLGYFNRPLNEYGMLVEEALDKLKNDSDRDVRNFCIA